jgi:pSer/pThr/pTyr-binding forkhead associated (FHA) protein
MNLREFEVRLQSLLEVDLLNVLPGRTIEDVIIQKLAAAVQQNTIEQDNKLIFAPDAYNLVVHPDISTRWQDQKLLEILLHSVTTVAKEAGYKFRISPRITVSTDTKIQINEPEIIASHRSESMADTNATPLDTGNLDDSKLPENAFLIVEGVKVFPLTLTVVNIGRRLDNQLVIDDPRVSRNHAQLRTIKGRYVVFDLNSTGGTFVNGQRTSQSVLYPGDVISLAGVALIFGQDNPPPRPDLKETAPLKKPTSDRPTAILKDSTTAKFKNK